MTSQRCGTKGALMGIKYSETGRTLAHFKPNQYGAPCAVCGTYVPPGAGQLSAKFNGKWQVVC